MLKYITDNNAKVEFNYNEQTIKFNDYDRFTTYRNDKGMNLLPEYVSEATSDEPVFMLRSAFDRYYSGTPLTINLDDYSIRMLKNNGNLLIPLSTLNDIFFSFSGFQLVSIGDTVFYTDPITLGDSSNEYTKRYYAVEKKETLSEEMTLFNYNELCLNLDLHYGLKDTQKIKDFDIYLSRMGLKEEYLSGNVFRIEKANKQLTTVCLVDFHSSFSNSSPYLDTEKYNLEGEPTENNKAYVDRLENFFVLSFIRSGFLGEFEPYERRGDTVFITFDSFSVKKKNEYYNKNKDEAPDLTDTVELFSYALERLSNEDSDVKNVVIDVSCNMGGTAVTCAYAIDAVTKKTNITVYDPITNALRQNVVSCDLNLDGKVDDNDQSILMLSKNVAIITSDTSFSCGNLFPCNIKYGNNNVLILGQQSGGGACVVGYVATAAGSCMKISGRSQLVSTKNGSIQDIDNGLTPDIYLSYYRMYDRDYVANLVSEQFRH